MGKKLKKEGRKKKMSHNLKRLKPPRIKYWVLAGILIGTMIGICLLQDYSHKNSELILENPSRFETGGSSIPQKSAPVLSVLDFQSIYGRAFTFHVNVTESDNYNLRAYLDVGYEYLLLVEEMNTIGDTSMFQITCYESMFAGCSEESFSRIVVNCTTEFSVTTVKYLSFLVDRTAPTLNILTPYYISEVEQIVASASDASEPYGDILLSYRLNNIYQLDDFDTLSNGQYTLKVTATDIASNSFSDSQQIYICKDLPNITAEINIMANMLQYNLSAQGVDLYNLVEIAIDSEVWCADETFGLDKSSEINVANLSDGGHSVTFTVRDVTLRHTQKSYLFYIDNTLPILSLQYQATGRNYVNLTINVNEVNDFSVKIQKFQGGQSNIVVSKTQFISHGLNVYSFRIQLPLAVAGNNTYLVEIFDSYFNQVSKILPIEIFWRIISRSNHCLLVN
jgi:hypothetical protein